MKENRKPSLRLYSAITSLRFGLGKVCVLAAALLYIARDECFCSANVIEI
jgi:hypothetical protein